MMGHPTEERPRFFTNIFREAVRCKSILDEGEVTSRTALARREGVSRARITQILDLLKLDQDIQDFLLGLDAEDPRLRNVTERKLRELVKLPAEEQRAMFWSII